MDRPIIDFSVIWFSHIENIYDAELKLFQKKSFHWTEGSQVWDWDNCRITWVKRSEKELRVVVRSSKMVYSDYRKKEVKVKYMYGFDVNVNTIEHPQLEPYREPIENKEKKYGQLRERWVIKLDKDYYIWQWSSNEKGKSLENSEVFKIYKAIRKSIEDSTLPVKKNIFLVEDIPYDNRIIPVIYQPAIDSWKNFVREVHCHEISENEYEVTILFENEQLRKHGKLDVFYRIFRLFRYGRITDIESFRILLDKGKPKSLQFKGIFSCEYTIEYDNIHGDKPHFGKVPAHEIKYYFIDEMHPIIFINTANHAMSFHDTNHKLWKWEYIPWEKDSAIIYGQKSRCQIDKFSWPKNNFNK
jgi:hypothetical protein